MYLFFLLLLGLCIWDTGLLLRKSDVPQREMRFFTTSLLIVLLCSVLFLWGPGKTYLITPIYLIFYGFPLFFITRRRLSFRSSLRFADERILLLSDALKVLTYGMYTLFVLTLFIKVSVDLFFSDINMSLFESLMGTMGSSIALMIYIVQASRRFPGKNVMERLALFFNGRSFTQIFLLPVGLGFLFALISSFLAVMRPVNPQTPLSDILRETRLEIVLGLFIFFAIFVAPVIEEIVFRGYFFKVLQKIQNTLIAVLVVSITFGLLHVSQYWGDWLAIIVVSLLGLTLTLVRAGTGSTLATVFMHFTYNLFVTIAPVFLLLMLNPSYLEYQMKYESLTLQEKKEVLEASIHKRPFVADSYNDLAWVYYVEGEQLETALDYVEKALHYDDGNRAYLDTKMRILQKMGKVDEAMVIFNGLKRRVNQ